MTFYSNDDVGIMCDRFDKDQNGQISISELIVLFRVMEPGITKDECVRRLEEYDVVRYSTFY